MINLHDKKKFTSSMAKECTTHFIWVCPICDDYWISEDGESKEKWMERLYKEEKIRYVTNNHMQGLCCPECYKDPEFKDWTI